MSADSPQRKVQQRIEEDVAALRAKIMNKAVIPERNVVRADIMVTPLDDIYQIIQTYHWGYLHNYACIVLTRLVKEFYAHLEVVQNDDNGIVLQSTIAGHIIMVDPKVISQIIGVPVLQISASPFNEVVLSPSLDNLKEFFHAVLQGKERAFTIKIGVLSLSHRMLTKIFQHNVWPIVRRSDLILKRAQFLYVICLRLLFCLCKYILGIMLEARDESNAGLPFSCLLTQIILQSGIDVAGEPKMKIQIPSASRP
jgi:hypothetical protein